jgi:hypothetical protein
MHPFLLHLGKAVHKPIVVALEAIEDVKRKLYWLNIADVREALFLDKGLKLRVEILFDKRNNLVSDLSVNLASCSLVSFDAVLSKLLLVEHHHLTLVNPVFELLHLLHVVHLHLLHP